MRIKFITLNIWKNSTIIDSAVAFIKKENPDIINLQEVYNAKDASLDKRYRTLEILKKDLSLSYFHFAAKFRDITKKDNLYAEQGNAIFSRFPIMKSGAIFFDIPYRVVNDYEQKRIYDQLPKNLQSVVVEVEDTTFYIYNVHGIWGTDGKDSKRRLKMSQTIVDQVKDKRNVILAGDFNLRPNTQTIKNIEGYLKNVFKDELTTTFNLKRKSDPGGYSTAVVDMIFVSPDMKVIDHYCPQVDVSDHLPLVCTLEV